MIIHLVQYQIYLNAYLISAIQILIIQGLLSIHYNQSWVLSPVLAPWCTVLGPQSCPWSLVLSPWSITRSHNGEANFVTKSWSFIFRHYRLEWTETAFGYMHACGYITCMVYSGRLIWLSVPHCTLNISSAHLQNLTMGSLILYGKL